MSNDFDNDFNEFNNDDFDDFKSQNALKDIWQNNPLVKIAVVGLGVVFVIVLLVFLLSGEDPNRSMVGTTPDQREAPGGEVSQAYGDAIDQVNQNRTEQAMADPNTSAVPIPYNLEQQDLLTDPNDAPPFDDFDPLAAWRQQAVPEEAAVEEEPVLVPYEGPVQPQPVPGPSPEVVNSLAQAMSQQMGDIMGVQAIAPARIMQVTGEEYLNPPVEEGTTPNNVQMVDTDGDGIVDTALTTDPNTEEVTVETILIPAGTINYGQMVIEANSDVPGPVLVQLVSGPLAGARLIGSFQTRNKVLVLQFDSVVVNGLNSPVNAIAIDPTTTLPGVATEVDNRYWSRVLLPAAGRFIEGLGRGFAQDSETTIVTGDVVTTTRNNLDFEQELGQGVEEAAEQIADFMDDEADDIEPLVRVARGTPVGIFFTEPVLEQ